MKPGDLVEIDWHDSSGGRISKLGLLRKIDVPVTSWGVFIGEYGEEEKHVCLLTELFRRKFGCLGFEVNAIIVKTIKKTKVLVKSVLDVEKLKASIDPKIEEQLTAGKMNFMVGGLLNPLDLQPRRKIK